MSRITSDMRICSQVIDDVELKDFSLGGGGGGGGALLGEVV